jgi:hypothetical protein
MPGCERAEQAFNETAAKFAVMPSAPHVGLVNCDDQPILCNSWSSGTANLFVFEMLPPPAAIDIYKLRLNRTTVTSDQLMNIHTEGAKNKLKLYESIFHPFNGKAVELGLAVPFGWLCWVTNLIPSWLLMLTVSGGTRYMM